MRSGLSNIMVLNQRRGRPISEEIHETLYISDDKKEKKELNGKVESKATHNQHRPEMICKAKRILIAVTTTLNFS
jgi:hypothetical protein